MTNKGVNKITTVTEIQFLKQAKYTYKMNYLMAKSLVEGKTTSEILRWAEIIVKTQKDIFEE